MLSNVHDEILQEKVTNLECNKPYTLYSVPDNNEILQRPNGRDIDTNVQKRDPDKALVQVECSHKNLPLVTGMQVLDKTKSQYLLTHGRYKVALDSTNGSNRAFGIITASETQSEPAFEF